MKGKRRNKIRMITFVAAAFLVLAGTTISGYVEAARLRRDLQYTYDRALGDLNDCISSMQVTLEKSLYANTPTQQNGLAARVMREASLAKGALAVLPVSDDSLYEASRFITQAGDFAMTLSRRISAGGTITDEEYESLRQLGEYAARLQETLRSADPDFTSGSTDSFKDTAEEFADYPTLIYDGPFSDHIAQKQPAFLEGEDELPQGNAQKNAADFLGVSASELAHEGDTAGNLATYNFTRDTQRITVTRLGGHVAALIDSREIGEETLSVDEAKAAAAAFLESHGLTGMKESYYEVSDGVCTINYAFAQDGVICYPDLIKVSVALDNGGIVEYNASGFLMNHTDRELAAAALTADEARASVSPHLSPDEGRLALIPTAGLNEVLTYEFACTGENGEEILVYINAETGMEEQILILIKTDSGVLTR